MTTLNETSKLNKAKKNFERKMFVQTIGIISPVNPMAKITSKEKNQKLVQKFKDLLKKTGDYYFPVKGKYGITEPSFMIFNITKKDLEMKANIFKQESFIFGILSDGDFDFKFYKRKPNKKSYYLVDSQIGYVEKSDEGDLYTTKGSDFKFSIPFPELQEYVNIHENLIKERSSKSKTYKRLVKDKIQKILDDSCTPFSRRMKRAFVYGADWNNQFEEFMENLKK